MTNIIFISDQFYPRTSADAEQIISSLSAIGKLKKVTLLSASYSFRESVTKNDLEQYYSKECTFDLRFISHLFPLVRGLEKLSFAIQACLFLRNKKYELVYTRNIPVLFFCLLFTRLPLVFESYRPWPRRNIISKLFFSFLSNKDRLNGVILHSKFAEKSFIDVGFTDTKLLVAHNAFDASDYPLSIENEVRLKYGIPTNKLVVTYSGRVTIEKGLNKMLELARSYKDVFFLIVGSEKEGEIEKISKSIPNVKVLGWLNKKSVFSILQASDILYLPPTLRARDISKNTVLPLKTFIYKASGTAIFGPIAEDICEVLSHNENAFLVEPDNEKKEHEGFKILIENSELRKTLGRNAKMDMENLTWENRAHSIVNFIEAKIN